VSSTALSNQWFSGAAVKPANPRTSLRVLTNEPARSQGWRAVRATSASCVNYIRLESATVAYFHSLSETDLAAENELGTALGYSTGLVDFNE
jgi:hypothetical protein